MEKNVADNHLEKHENHEDHSQHHANHGQHYGHHDHHEMMIEDFKKRFFVSMILTIPILLLSPMIQDWFNFTIEFAGSGYLLFGLSTLIYFYGGWPFLKGLKDELSDKNPGMMTLIALAITVSYLFSSATVFGLEGNDFFWELATLIDIMLLGHWIEMRSIMSASSALEELAKLLPDTAHLIKGNEVLEVKVNTLATNDIILIKPGEKIPADGMIIKGNSYIDESMLTGESKPVAKGVNDFLIAGSINKDGSFEVKVSEIGQNTFLSKVIKMVENAQASKSKTQNLADKAAFWLTIIALTVGITTFIVWYLISKDTAFAITRMATVMVITCPHALGLAMPLVVAVSTAEAAKNGLLIKNRTQFENARMIDTVVFDKTGTLTHGNFQVNTIEIFDDTYTKERVIVLAASLEQSSEHPIATGIMNKLEELQLSTVNVVDFKALKGKGVQGIINNAQAMVVSPSYLKENNILVEYNEADDDILTNVFLLVDHKPIALIGLSDKIRDESYDAIKQLQAQNIKTWMLTGDNEKTAKYVSDKLELDGYFAKVLPDEKLNKIKELQDQGMFVAMTGDGVNDAPALAQANVGIAVGSGTDVAAETADIILVNSNPQDVVTLINFGKETYKKMIQNLIWATAYNVIAIPLAAGVLHNYGIMISPAVGAILMSLSTIIVAINAKLLKVK